VINLGKLAKDAKDLILGNDNSDKEAEDFKTELQKAINSGVISKSDGTLLITSRTNADKMGEELLKRIEKDLTLARDGKEFDTAEEALEYEKEKEEKKELERRKKQALEAARIAENQKKKGTSGGGGTKNKLQDESTPKMKEEEILLEEKR
jgi:hypothetical protein